MFMNLIRVVTALGAALFLEEALHYCHLIGGALTIGGITLSQRNPSKAL